MSRPLIIRPLTPRPLLAPLDRRWVVSGLLLLSVWLLTLTLASALLNLAGVMLNGGGQAQLQAHGHPFVDTRELWGMPNAADVLSNLPFVAVGVIGLWQFRRLPMDTLVGDTQRALKVFFCGLVLTGLLSAVYHWQPDAWGLAMDRTGMAVGFAGVLALAAADRVGQCEARLTLWVVLPLAIVSAWLPLTHDNVLPWAVVQFGGIALVLSVARRSRVGGGLGVCWVGLIAIYALAKWAEVSDEAIFQVTGGWVSGHTLKHLVAALAAWPVITALRQNARIAGRIDRVVAEQVQHSEEPLHVR